MRRVELSLDLLVAPGEEGDDAVDRAAVLLAVDVADAGRLAALDVVVQAGRAAAPAGLGAVAGAKQEDLLEQVERAPHLLGVGVGAEVGAVAAVALAREVDARELLVEGDRDVGVGLVVAQADVEARLVLLDEVLLEQQRLRLGGGDRGLDRVDEGHQLRRAVPGAPGEVRGDALLERARLADIDHPPLLVTEEVHAGLVGKRAALLSQLVWGLRGHPLEDRDAQVPPRRRWPTAGRRASRRGSPTRPDANPPVSPPKTVKLSNTS